ncbi:glycosyltransferase family 4 protein [Gulosibacter chungangensis]|uniref:D-inositol 3-phosphate glycosyltransferase n=1 Tax=Gulosibacter chungangensis TaxID=979746 RepID=A0A7J5B7E1_9MICO|nr:glycosyltransferase family 4 protein [Gulosibacter chungangensis]KAB1640838.1 glycosyltransferase family 4 protein [Gulosibacter chungangensis]
MRVLLLTHYFMPETGAPQRRWDSLIREFVAAGHEVAVMCPPPHHPTGQVSDRYKQYYRRGSAERAENGALVFRVGYLPHRGDLITRTVDHLASSLTSISRASKLIRRKKFVPDVIIATAPAIPTLIAGKALSKRFKIPLIVEMRDAWPDLVTHVSGLSGSSPIGFAKKLIHRYVTSLQRAATKVVTTTERFGSILENRGMGEVAVVRNGANLSRFTKLPPIDSDHQELRAVYLGTMGRSQGLDVVIRATKQLKDEGVPVQVRMIGSGHDRPALIALNEELGSPVEILPAVSPDQVASHYAWADTTLVTLRDWKPFEWTIPSKLYEVLSSGRHVTGILAGEGAEILSNAHGGAVVSPGDVEGLVAFWRDLAANRDQLNVGTSGRAWVQANVTYDRLASQYFEILEEVANTSATR